MSENPCNYSVPEPPPVPNNNSSIHDLIIQDLQQRKDFGLEKYGTLLQLGNGRKTAVDLHQEMLDAVVYSRLLIEEQNAIIKALLLMVKEFLVENPDNLKGEFLISDKGLIAGGLALDTLELLGYIGLLGSSHYYFKEKAINLMGED